MSGPDLPPAAQAGIDATKPEFKQLGKSGLRVSVPVLGTMGLGSKQFFNWMLEGEEALKVLKDAYDLGFTTWDTANVYSNGMSEELIGQALKQFKIPRHKVTILTKCALVVAEEPGLKLISFGERMQQSRDYVNQHGLSRAAIFNAVEASLKRLDTDYIDVFQIHRYDPTLPPEETMKALHDLVQSGKVRYIGASSMWTYQFASLQFIAEKNGWTKFISMQNHYSLLYREEEREMNKFCKETGVGIIPWSPLGEGKLARPIESASTTRSSGPRPPLTGDLTDADRAIISRVEELSKKKDWTMSQVALTWLKEKGAIPIISGTKRERMVEAAEIKGKSLTKEEVDYLEEPYVPRQILGHS